MDLGKDIPILDASSDSFKDEFEFNIWSTQSCSDYRNDRERPYNGQRHTTDGERGKTEVKGVTFRDVQDCIIQGMLAASGDPGLSHSTVEISKEFIGTKYAHKNTWRPQDVYKIPDNFDPLAAVQNAMCFIEHYMGIYPNVPNLNTKDQPS